MSERTESLYSPRYAEGAQQLIEQLNSPPEKPLTPEEKQAVLKFEDAIFNIDPSLAPQIYNRVPKEIFDQGSIKEITHNLQFHSYYVYPDFYLTDEGKKVAQDQLDNLAEVETPDIKLQAALNALLAADNLDKVKVALLALSGTDFKKAIAEKSIKYPETQLIGALLEGKDVPTFERLPIIKRPDNLVKKIKLLFAYKDYLKAVRATVQEGDDSNQKEAQLAILNLYQAYVNGYLAEIYPDLMAYLDFSKPQDAKDETPPVLPGEIKTELAGYSGRVGRIYNYVQLRNAKKAAELMDRIRNGRFQNEDGTYSPILSSLEDSIKQVNAAEQSSQPPAFNPEEVAALRAVEIDAKNMQDLLTIVLREQDMLSAEPPESYDENRTTRAGDEKWQVPITAAPNLSADGIKGILPVPESYSRPMVQQVSPYGAIAVAGHEDWHALQAENAFRSEGLHFGKDIRGRGYVSLREAAAIRRERQIMSRLFGINRPTASTYLRGVESLLAGGDKTAIAKAFYDELRAKDPTGDPQKAALLAANRSLRLSSFGGFNTQPLEYIEQSVINEAAANLPPELQDQLFAEGGMNLRDLATLHKYDLTHRSNRVSSGRSYEEIAEEWLREHYLKVPQQAVKS